MMRPTLKRTTASLALLGLFLLAACKGSSGSSAPPAVAPTISTQPTNQTALAGATATFSVAASGTAPLAYQWNKGGSAITGATATSYTTPATVLTDSGSSFTVTISNSAGSVTSSAATLTVQPSATGLVYTDPTTGTYLLKKNTTLSTANHLVLELWGPTTGTAIGVSLSLSADTTKVTWTNVATTDPANTLMQNGTTFNLGAGTPLLKAKATGNVLQATLAQKGAAPAALNAALLRVALDLKSGLALPLGTAITLAADNTKSQVLTDQASNPTPITVSVGALSAQ